MGTALGWGQGMDLIHDDCMNSAQGVPSFCAQDQEKGFRSCDQDVTGILGLSLAFALGCVSDTYVDLDLAIARDLLTRGGTILGSSNHANPFAYPVKLPDGRVEVHDVSAICMKHLANLDLEGLVVGLNRRGISELKELPEEVQEIVQDLVAIAQLDTEFAEDDAETDFVELEEYVKVGTLLIQSLAADADNDPTD